MTADQISFPPIHDLPPGEFDARRTHLLDEIAKESRKTRRGSPKWRLVVVVALAVAVVTGIVSSLWSPRADALPGPFQPAQAALSEQFQIDVTPLPDSTQPGISEQDAEQIALAGGRPVPGVTATLVDATDFGGDAVVTDGTRSALISNRPAWLVLIPNQQAPIMYPKGKTGPASYSVTRAALIDATDGTFLIEAELPAN